MVCALPREPLKGKPASAKVCTKTSTTFFNDEGQNAMAKKVKASAKPTAGNPRQQLILLVGVAVAAVILIIGVVVVNQLTAGSAQTIEENETFAGIPLSGEFADVRTIERASDVAESVSMGIGEDGIPFVGNPDAAIQIADFSDFTCPACATYHDTVERLIRDFARSGDILFKYYPVAAQSRAPASTHAARGMICAGEQGAAWEMFDELFRIHNAESGRAFDPARVEKAANDIGIDGDKVRACMNTNRADRALTETNRVAQKYGANATPTILYRLRGQTDWQALPTADGQIGGGRPYEQLAELIRQANAQ
jgi:protein-disulfide isomerase